MTNTTEQGYSQLSKDLSHKSFTMQEVPVEMTRTSYAVQMNIMITATQEQPAFFICTAKEINLSVNGSLIANSPYAAPESSGIMDESVILESDIPHRLNVPVKIGPSHSLKKTNVVHVA
ncbi:unnamed protein product, partial [Anisakis simplex]|uniref:Vitellogenin domain-containing protein n=1 Tax=Anisakis simplex TaxID=6269 RepID=A0A0M3JF19_ANISI